MVSVKSTTQSLSTKYSAVPRYLCGIDVLLTLRFSWCFTQRGRFAYPMLSIAIVRDHIISDATPRVSPSQRRVVMLFLAARHHNVRLPCQQIFITRNLSITFRPPQNILDLKLNYLKNKARKGRPVFLSQSYSPFFNYLTLMELALHLR